MKSLKMKIASSHLKNEGILKYFTSIWRISPLSELWFDIHRFLIVYSLTYESPQKTTHTVDVAVHWMLHKIQTYSAPMEMKISLCPLKKNIASQRHDGGKVKVKVLILRG